MLKEDYFLSYELKAKKLVQTGSGMPFDKFKSLYGQKIIDILESLWNQQFDLVTRNRVIDALRIGGLPPEFLNDVTGNVEKWVENQFNPTYAMAIMLAATGNNKIAGMMDDINKAVGASILFNPNVQRMIDYMTHEGANLAVNLTNNQLQSLKTILKHAIQNEWTITDTYTFMKRGITLTDMESKWLIKFEERTLKAQMKYFREEFPVLFPNLPPLSESEILKRAKAVTEDRVKVKFNKYQRSRAQRIAVTELKRAKVAGEIEAHKQALEAGVISEALKQWDKQNFKDNWESSDLYNGKRIDIDEDFSQFGIPQKTTMLDFSGPGEINEQCVLVFYARK